MSGHFTEEQQNEIREKLFCAGMEYLKEFGLQRMTVDKLVAAAGIAKGSFYNFFKSKEDFLSALSEYAGEKMNAILERQLDGRESFSAEEFISFLRTYLHSDYDLMATLTIDDFLWAKKHLANYHTFDPSSQMLIVAHWMDIIDDLSSGAEPGVVVNLIKCIYAMREHRDTMVQSALDESIEVQLRTIQTYLTDEK